MVTKLKRKLCLAAGKIRREKWLLFRGEVKEEKRRGRRRQERDNGGVDEEE